MKVAVETAAEASFVAAASAWEIQTSRKRGNESKSCSRRGRRGCSRGMKSKLATSIKHLESWASLGSKGNILIHKIGRKMQHLCMFRIQCTFSLPNILKNNTFRTRDKSNTNRLLHIWDSKRCMEWSRIMVNKWFNSLRQRKRKGYLGRWKTLLKRFLLGSRKSFKLHKIKQIIK